MISVLNTILFVAVLLCVTDAAFLKRPNSQQVYAKQRVTLECSSTIEKPVVWYFGAANGDFTPITYAGHVLPELVGHYEIDAAGVGAYNLVIHQTANTDSGKYVCMENEGMDKNRSASANVTVIPCPTTTSKEHSTPSKPVIPVIPCQNNAMTSSSTSTRLIIATLIIAAIILTTCFVD